MEEKMNPEEKSDLWADLALLTVLGIGSGLASGATRSLLGLPVNSAFNPGQPRPGSSNLISPPPTEERILRAPSPLENPTKTPSATTKVAEPPSKLVTPASRSPLIAPPERKKLDEVNATARYQLRRESRAFPPYYHQTYLRPQATGSVRYHQRDWTVVSLMMVDWIVATMLVENFVSFVEMINTWSGSHFDRKLWRAEYYNGTGTAKLWNSPSWASLPMIDSWKEALSLGRDQRLWTVMQYARITTGGKQLEIPPNVAGGIMGFVVHQVQPAKSREPLVGGYIAQDCDDYGRPRPAPHLFRPQRVVLPYHDVVTLAVNSRVWALTTSSSDGTERVVPVLPRGLSAAEPDVANTVPGTTLMNCAGLDIEREDGTRQDLCHAALYSYPWPRKRRRR
jgi:hypothetical protein